jgi:hypothetical protein
MPLAISKAFTCGGIFLPSIIISSFLLSKCVNTSFPSPVPLAALRAARFLPDHLSTTENTEDLHKSKEVKSMETVSFRDLQTLRLKLVVIFE